MTSLAHRCSPCCPPLGAVARPVSGQRLAKQVALAVSLVTFAGRGCSSRVAVPPRRGMQFAEQVAWIRPLGAYYALGLDGIGLTLVLLVVIVTPVVIIAPAGGTSTDRARARRARSCHRSTARAGVLRAGAGGGELRAVPLPGHRRLPVLRVLRGHPGPDVLPDRRLRAGAAPDVRGRQVLDLRPARRVRHAGLGDRAVRAVGPARRAQLSAQHPEPAGLSAPGPSAGCSSASCSPSRSRRRWFRCTPGCRTRPSSPPPAAPP